VRTILNKELRLPNGAHGAPYIAFTTPSHRGEELLARAALDYIGRHKVA
jgi:hypothetical protein